MEAAGGMILAGVKRCIRNITCPSVTGRTSAGTQVEGKLILLKTKRRPLYLKTQSVPRCKKISSRLLKPISLCCKWYKSLFVLR